MPFKKNPPPDRRDFIVRGEIHKEVKIPELGVAFTLNWTDGEEFLVTATWYSQGAAEKQITRAAKRLMDRGGDAGTKT